MHALYVLHAKQTGTSAFPAKSDQTDQKKKNPQNTPEQAKTEDGVGCESRT